MSIKSQRNVIVITPGGRTAPGGISRMVDYCVRSWPQDSPYSLHVIDSYGPGSKFLMPFFAFRAYVMTLSLLLAGRVGILHINLSERLSIWRKSVFILLGSWFHIPVVIHLHGAEFEDYINNAGPLRRGLTVLLLRRAQKLIVLGMYWRDFLHNRLGIEPTRVAILNNAVPDVALPAIRMQTQECRLLFMGRVGKRKGIPLLLNALAEPQLSRLSWHMTIAGNGEIEIYKRRAEALGIAERITFTGLLNEKQARAKLSQADIFVLPSRREGLPMAILEALSYGCPVVASNVGSIPDAVIHGKTGLLVPHDDNHALAQALARLVEDAPYRTQLGAQARQLFDTKFTLNAHNAALETLYDQL